MTTVLVLNGDPPQVQLLKQWAEKGPVIAADGGAQVCLSAGISPEEVVGDFDSMDPQQLPEAWKTVHLSDQNSTDFEKVLSRLPKDTTDLVVLGGLGRRLDHTLTNLLIATAMDPLIRIQFVCEEADVIRITPQTSWRGEPVIGATVSLLPLQTVTGVTTEGLKWNLNHQTMGPSAQLGQSNCVAGPARIDVESGVLFAWLER